MSQNEFMYFLPKSAPPPQFSNLVIDTTIHWVTQAKHLLFPFPLNRLAWFPFLVSLISIYFSRPLIPVSDPHGGLGYCGHPPTFIHSHLPLPLHLFTTIIHLSLVSKAISDQLSLLFKIFLSYDPYKKANSAWQTKPPRADLCLISPSLFPHCNP